MIVSIELRCVTCVSCDDQRGSVVFCNDNVRLKTVQTFVGIDYFLDRIDRHRFKIITADFRLI